MKAYHARIINFSVFIGSAWQSSGRKWRLRTKDWRSSLWILTNRLLIPDQALQSGSTRRPHRRRFCWNRYPHRWMARVVTHDMARKIQKKPIGCKSRSIGLIRLCHQKRSNNLSSLLVRPDLIWTWWLKKFKLHSKMWALTKDPCKQQQTWIQNLSLCYRQIRGTLADASTRPNQWHSNSQIKPAET